MKKVFGMVICIIAFTSCMAGSVLACNAPEYNISAITYITGDWTVNDSQNRTNETIVLTGNLILGLGGNLTLKNVTLMMNCTSDGLYQIEVQNGGTMNIYDLDNDNTTTFDSSNITAFNPNFEYKFRVRAGANFTMRNSELHECGYGPFLAVDNYGLFIQTDNAFIDHNLISQNYNGIVLYGSDALVSNNMIEWCDTGILATTWSNGTIENNVITWSYSYGIKVDGWDNTKKWSSNPLVRGNKIIKTGRETVTAVALQIDDYSSPTIIDNQIIDFTEDGIYLGERCQPFLNNNTFDACGGRYGIASSEPRSVYIANCTIKNTDWWDLSLAGAYFILTNTTFNRSKVIFQNPGDGSNLTVKWFLNSRVVDSLGNPISEAAVRIRDNANGTYDKNYTTDSNGWVNWVVLRDYYRTSSGNISYYPYNITVSKSGYLMAYAEVEMNENKYITITLQDIEAPNADAGPDQAVNEDTIVYLDGSGSTDNAGIVNYTWSFYDGGLLVNRYGANVSYIFAQPGVYTITLNVTDAAGNWDTDTCVIFVNDITTPVADAGPDQSVNEDDIVQFDGSASTDNVGSVWYNWTFGDGDYNNGTNPTATHTYADADIYIVTLNVSDAVGNWDTDTCLIFVNNVAPTANAGIDKMVNEGVLTTFDGSASNDTASDMPSLSYAWYFGDGNNTTGKISSHAYGNNGIYIATLVVTDDNGYIDSDTATVMVNNVAPTIESVPDQTAQQGVLFTLKINASDVPADVLTFSDNTTLFEINPVTGIIQFTPTNADVGVHFVNVTVADDDGGSSFATFNITVLNTNDAPVMEPIPAKDATEDVPFTLQVGASDPDAGDVLAYSLTAYPVGMTINSMTGLIAWTPTNAAVGRHAVTVRVRDITGLYCEETFAITVANVNDAPEISTVSLPNATEDNPYFYGIQANDVDAGDTLAFTLDSAPSFLSIDVGTGLIYGMPTNVNVGAHQIVVNVSEGITFVTKAFNLSVLNVNYLPIITSYPNTVVKPGAVYTYSATAEDTDAGDVLTYSLVTAPEGMTINNQTGRVAWTPSEAQAGQTHQVVIQVSDGHGSTTQTFSIVVDELPVEPYHPFFDDYIWVGIVLFLITILIIMTLAMRHKDE